MVPVTCALLWPAEGGKLCPAGAGWNAAFVMVKDRPGRKLTFDFDGNFQTFRREPLKFIRCPVEGIRRRILPEFFIVFLPAEDALHQRQSDRKLRYCPGCAVAVPDAVSPKVAHDANPRICPNLSLCATEFRLCLKARNISIPRHTRLPNVLLIGYRINIRISSQRGAHVEDQGSKPGR